MTLDDIKKKAKENAEETYKDRSLIFLKTFCPWEFYGSPLVLQPDVKVLNMRDFLYDGEWHEMLRTLAHMNIPHYSVRFEDSPDTFTTILAVAPTWACLNHYIENRNAQEVGLGGRFWV